MRILVIGAFDFVNFDTGGQPVKSRELYYALQNKYKEENVDYFETGEWNKSPISHLIALIRKIRKSSCIIMLPARNGVKVISPLIIMFRRRNCRIFYDVVGGWLPQLLNNKKWLMLYTYIHQIVI